MVGPACGQIAENCVYWDRGLDQNHVSFSNEKVSAFCWWLIMWFTQDIFLTHGKLTSQSGPQGMGDLVFND